VTNKNTSSDETARRKPRRRHRHRPAAQRSATRSGQPTKKHAPPRSVTGTLTVTARGFGFVETSEGRDVFVPSENLHTALDGDSVAAEIIREPADRNPVGRVIRVIERSCSEIVGVFRERDGMAVVVPDDERLKKPLAVPPGAEKPKSGSSLPVDGLIVVAELVRWDDPAELPEGRVIEVLGKPDDPGIDARIVARANKLPREFPREVKESLRKIKPASIRDELSRREDFRSTVCVTIDPDDAKDFDDAVSLVQLPNGYYELGVHIADVTFYVTEGSPIDREAARRGTSVYFVRDVIPMLPERLSNDLCSLRPNEDRPAFSVIMSIDSRGDVRNYRIVETVIRSARRFTYREVEEILGGAADRFARTIHNMMMLSTILRRRREEIGSVDFDSTEPVISLDGNGIPYEVRPSERLDANRLVEEFMLIANRTVARHVTAKNGEAAGGRQRGARCAQDSGAAAFPFIYRIHEKPDDADVRAFLTVLERLGISYRVVSELTPDDYRKLLDIVENLPFKDFVEKVALRSITKAVYATENLGHFGLAFDAYTHFTSPIRRYADLVVHRLLKRYADGRPNAPARLAATLDKICLACSARERAASAAEREYTQLKSMEFLAGKVGEVYDGVIAGVTSFGFFVELTHYLIEGLVHISELTDDWYEYDKDEYQLRGQKSGRTYRLGDPVRVSIKRVSVEERRADFSLVAE
jgi:ribonuclease R